MKRLSNSEQSPSAHKKPRASSLSKPDDSPKKTTNNKGPKPKFVSKSKTQKKLVQQESKQSLNKNKSETKGSGSNNNESTFSKEIDFVGKKTVPKTKLQSKNRSTDFKTKPKFGKKTGSTQKKIGLLKKKQGKSFQEIPSKLLGKDGKPKWNELKEEKKKLKEDRKTRRSGEEQYQLTVKAKSIWEKLRYKNLSAEMREQLVNELFLLLKKEIPNVVHSHDVSRVVQWMLKLGSASVRTSICEALSANTVTYLQSKFARFCVKRALKYGSKADREHLIQSCKGHFFKLLAHSFSYKVVELMYSTHANAEQRKQMHKEVYGEMHVLLPAEVTSLANVPDNIKTAVLAGTKVNLTKLLEKKHLLTSTLFLSVLNDFFSSCSAQDCNEILELLYVDILQLLSTKEGSRVALQVVWRATNKMKKAIVKLLKGRVREIATSEAGHVLLVALIDCLDDTVLLKKALIPELLSDALVLVKNEWGRRVILYLVAHRDPAYFHPRQIENWGKGDAISSRKKDTKLREEEMLEAVSGPLLEQIAKDPKTWLGDNSVAMVSLAIMKSGKGQPLLAVFESVVTYMLDPENMLEVKKMKFHIVEHSALHLVFKKLILEDQAHPDRTTESFSMVLASRLTENNLNHILQFNRGCFLLIVLLESKNKKVCKIIRSKVTDSMKTFLQKQETTGSKILLEKLAEES